MAYYISKGAFVTTNSYHGTCFSLLFNRPFVTFVGSTRTRFDTLLGALDLSERYINLPTGDFSNMDNLIAKDIDFNKANQLIAIESVRVQAWLKIALAAPKIGEMRTGNETE